LVTQAASAARTKSANVKEQIVHVNVAKGATARSPVALKNVLVLGIVLVALPIAALLSAPTIAATANLRAVLEKANALINANRMVTETKLDDRPQTGNQKLLCNEPEVIDKTNQDHLHCLGYQRSLIMQYEIAEIPTPRTRSCTRLLDVY
ncbi:hypothetical protein ILUMI_14907, partial [Ignelater luminosus]